MLEAHQAVKHLHHILLKEMPVIVLSLHQLEPAWEGPRVDSWLGYGVAVTVCLATDCDTG